MFEFCDFMWELGSRKDSGLRGKMGGLNLIQHICILFFIFGKDFAVYRVYLMRRKKKETSV